MIAIPRSAIRVEIVMMAIETDIKRVLLVDAHPILRDGVALIIRDDPRLEVSGRVGNENEAIEAIEQDRPDIVVAGLMLGEGGGMELLRKLHERWPELPVLILSMHDEVLHAERVLRTGARGYVMKQEPTQTVLAAIHKVLRGEIYLSESMASRLLVKLAGGRSPEDSANSLGRLSDRELQVFEMIGRGEPPRDIARHLGLSVKTVDAHRERIKEKLGVKSGNELMRYAVSYQMNNPIA
ncbi:MAG TPA: response regulator transcription factor [Tepidisphaeraceae bacterium]|nr:response regulator transcription factor [Tepidisphaeraceae bacterium]